MSGNKLGPGQKTIHTEEVVEYVADLMSRRIPKHALKKLLEKELGTEISIQAYERLRKDARKLMINNSGRSYDEHRGTAVAFYESIIADEDSAFRDKLTAQTRLDNILGLEKQFTPFSAQQLAEEAKKCLAEIDDVIDGEVVQTEASPKADSVPEKS